MARRSAEETRAILLAGARDLLGRRPPTAITGRDVAQRTGLQPSLINRHFGSVDALLGLAAAELLAAWAAAIAQATPEDAPHAAARHLVEHDLDLTGLVAAFTARGEIPFPADQPAVEALHQRLVERPGEPPSRAQAAAVIALIVGWVALRSRLADFTGLGPDEYHAELDHLVERLLAP